MFPIIDRKRTGIRLRRIMDERGLSVKDVQQYLELGSVQSVYHWLNGLSMPTIDNLYALSELFQMPIDDLVCGNRAMFLRISLIHNVNVLVLITKDLIKQHKFVGEITANAFILQVQ